MFALLFAVHLTAVADTPQDCKNQFWTAVIAGSSEDSQHSKLARDVRTGAERILKSNELTASQLRNFHLASLTNQWIEQTAITTCAIDRAHQALKSGQLELLCPTHAKAKNQAACYREWLSRQRVQNAAALVHLVEMGTTAAKEPPRSVAVLVDLILRPLEMFDSRENLAVKPAQVTAEARSAAKELGMPPEQLEMLFKAEQAEMFKTERETFATAKTALLNAIEPKLKELKTAKHPWTKSLEERVAKARTKSF